ncbi:MFS general substrate transporter [Polyplosphaeria fusca]|uniref:MFS general substrate transporter n=1 Tax=Polyplosphaeria fusca TaxID=682080 RepID=A0A9P4UWG8_9PLEO|nr:MFS general substrate transporter [Polyplosphaeria fusca]
MPPSIEADDDDGSTTPRPLTDERTPLLPEPTTSDPSASEPGIHDEEDEDAPLPVLQIVLLCYASFIEPIAYFSIFPYINTMIERTGGVETDSVGFYAGLIESLFSLTQMGVMVFWGKASDRYGRKPVLVVSLAGVSAATALFGFSQNLWQMVLFRCVAGVFAGTVVTIRAMISENSTKKTQARAFSYFAFVRNMGIFAGPLLGGIFDSPARKYKSVFGNSQFFKDYPHAFPGFVCGAIGASAIPLLMLFGRETLHLHKSRKKANEAPMSTWELLKHPGVAQVTIIYQYVLILAFAYTAVDPTFLYTPVDMGGIGFKDREELIGAAIALGGASQAIWLLFIFTPLHKRIGTGGVLRLCAATWPFFFAAHSLCNIFLRHGLVVAFWIVGPVSVVVGCGVAMAFTAIQLAVNDIAPSHETFGTLNAIVLAASSGLRAVVPALSTSLFAVGVKIRVLSGQLFWVVIILLACGLLPLLRILPEKAEGRPKRVEDEERRRGEADLQNGGAERD